MKVWITKYALTTGILCVEAWGTTQEGMIGYCTDHYGLEQYAHGEGRDWHRTESAAVARARQMAQTKRASLKQQIAKLDKWQPKIVEVAQ